MFLFRARVYFKCLQGARALLFSRLSLTHNFLFEFLQEHSNSQNRHALGAPLGNPAMSTHHPAGAAFSQLAFPSVHHHSLFPMMPPPGLMSGGPFPHQSKNPHGINDMGPPMFSVRKEFLCGLYIL